MDSEILLFGIMNLVGGVLAVFFIHFYEPADVESSTPEPQIYASAQRGNLPIAPLQP